jgi:transcriptional activator SPT8
MGSGGQISAVQPRPQSSLPVPEELGNILPSDTFSTNNASYSATNGNNAEDTSGTGSTIQNEDGLQDAPADDDDMNSLFGDDDGGGMLEAPMQLGDVDDDEFSRAIAEGIQPDEEAAGDVDMTDGGTGQDPETGAAEKPAADTSPTGEPSADTNGVNNLSESTGSHANGLPHSIDDETQDSRASVVEPEADKTPSSDTTFLDACFDGIVRVWDRRQPNPVARIRPAHGTPPWCMSACWSTDGNYIYAGRRNNCVEEYSLHKGLKAPERTFRFPAGSGPVSALAAMPNGRHLIW